MEHHCIEKRPLLRNCWRLTRAAAFRRNAGWANAVGPPGCLILGFPWGSLEFGWPARRRSRASWSGSIIVTLSLGSALAGRMVGRFARRIPNHRALAPEWQ